jgi:hypothetical protein
MYPGGLTLEEATQKTNKMMSMLFGSFDDEDEGEGYE